MLAVELFDALGRGDDRHELDFFAPARFERRDGVARGTARCKHGVDEEHRLFRNAVGELAVVLLRLERLLVAVHADMPHLCRRKDAVHAVDHAEPRAQDGHDGDAVVRNAVLRRLFEGRFHLDGHELHVAHALVRHDGRDLFDELAELLHGSVLVAQNGDLMLDEGMIEDKDVGIGHLSPPLLFRALREPRRVQPFRLSRASLRLRTLRKPARFRPSSCRC